MDHVVMDVEIAKTVDEVGGWDNTKDMGIGYAVIYEYPSDRFKIYGPSDADRTRMQQRLLQADRITGFNIWSFDFPVIWGMTKQEWKEAVAVQNMLRPKTDDILRRIYQARGVDPDNWQYMTHAGWSLDDVAPATIDFKKIAHGAQAPIWFQAGEHAKVIEYCIDDVAIERDLGRFIDQSGFVLNGKTGTTVRVPIPDWKPEVPA